MIHVRISEVKNRLSHYIRLVRGGEEVEIMDRDTPVARLVSVASASDNEGEASWLADLVREGIVTPARTRAGFPQKFFDKEKKPKGKGILKALLEERAEGWR